jgi:hypothetical protein
MERYYLVYRGQSYTMHFMECPGDGRLYILDLKNVYGTDSPGETSASSKKRTRNGKKNNSGVGPREAIDLIGQV